MLLVLGACTAWCQTEKTSLAMLGAIFSDIRVSDSALTVTTKASGQRFLYSVDDSTPTLLDYNQSVTLPQGFKKAEFKTRGFSLTLTKDLNEPFLYTVTEIIDTRSSGGERQSTERPLLIMASVLATPDH